MLVTRRGQRVKCCSLIKMKSFLGEPMVYKFILFFSFLLNSYITLLPNVYNLSGIRTFRVLRALRTISTVEGEAGDILYASFFLLMLNGS